MMTVASSAQIPFDFGNQQRNDFDSFLPGENQALIDLSKLIANNSVRHALYLWGQKATGKTHLLQAMCRKASEHGLQVAYIPLTQYQEISIEMLHDLGEMDLVCIDDIECIQGLNEWQQALTWLYNELRDNDHSIIFSANQSPQNISLELEDLKSRFSWDQVMQIKEADEDIKIQILKQEAQGRSFELNDDVIEYLIRRVDRNLASLINLLDKIDHASLAAKRKITIPFIKELIN